MTKNEWDDDVKRGVAYSTKLLDFMLKERGQLYGTIIHLLKLMEEDYVMLPTIEEFKEYGEKFYILYETNEEGEFRVSLKDREDDGDKAD